MRILRGLERIYPPGARITDPVQLSAYECDGSSAVRRRPLAVVFPETAEQVVRTLRLCYEEGVPFVARGSGTSLSGGSVPVPGGIVIALNRMNRILKLDPDKPSGVTWPSTRGAPTASSTV